MIDFSRPRGLMALGLAVLMAAFQAGCERESLAGGATGIENPGLVLAFQDDKGPLAVSGTLRIYCEHSIWLDSSIYSRTLHNQDTALIGSRDFEALAAEVLHGDSLGADSSLGFNIVVSGEKAEGILGGFRLRGSRSRGFTFEMSPDGVQPFLKARVLTAKFDSAWLKADLLLRAPVFLYPGQIAPAHMDKAINVVFVPGSPYAAWAGSSGSLAFPILPQGTFPVRAASVSFSAEGTAIRTSIKVYCTADSLSTSRPFAPERWEECVD